MIAVIVLLVVGIVLFTLRFVDVSRLRSDGVRTVGVSTRTWSDTYPVGEPGNIRAQTVYHTEVRFAGGAGKPHIGEVAGSYAVGTEVPVTYDPDDPRLVKPAEQASDIEYVG
jgi:hypothetical protein